MASTKARGPLAQWFRAMAASERTRITLANLKFDLARKRPLPLRRLLRVLCTMTKKGTWTGSSGPDDAENALETFLNDASESLFCHGPEIQDRGNLSLITDGDVFLKCYIRLSPGAIAVDRKRRMPQVKKILPRHVRRNAMVRSRRAFAWVTDSDALERDLRDAKDRRVPARVRDFLGLIFKKPTQHLVELRYPPDVAKTLPLAAPTVLEGACVTVYRSRDGAHGWGHALDLEHLRDGAVEAVHRPIPFTAAFTYRDLDVIGEERVRSESELTPLFSPGWLASDDEVVTKFSQKTPRKTKSP